MNSYWKRQALMFYPLGKTQKNLMGEKGSIHPHPTPCTSEGQKTVLMGVPNSQLSTNFSTKYQLTTNFLLAINFHIPTANIILS